MALSFNSTWMGGVSSLQHTPQQQQPLARPTPARGQLVEPLATPSSGSIGRVDASGAPSLVEDASYAVVHRLSSLRALVGDAFTRQTYLHAHRPVSAMSVKGLLLTTDAMPSAAAAAVVGQRKQSAATTMPTSLVNQRRPSTASSSPLQSRTSYGCTAADLGANKRSTAMNSIVHERPASAMLRSTQLKLDDLLSEENASNIAMRERGEAQYAAQLAAAAAAANSKSSDSLVFVEHRQQEDRIREEHDAGAVVEIGDEDVDSVDPRLLLVGGEESSLQMRGMVRPGSALEREAGREPLDEGATSSVPATDTGVTPCSAASSTTIGIVPERRPPQVPKRGSSNQTPSLPSSAADTNLQARIGRPLSACTSPHGVSHHTALVPAVYTTTANISKLSGTTSPDAPYFSCEHSEYAASLACSSRRDLSPDICSVSSSASCVPPLVMEGLPRGLASNSNNSSRPLSAASSYAERFRKKLETLECSKPLGISKMTVEANATTMMQEGPSTAAAIVDVAQSSAALAAPEGACPDDPNMQQQHPRPAEAAPVPSAIVEIVAAPAAVTAPPLTATSTESFSPPPVALVEVTDAIDSFLGMHFFSLKALDAELRLVEDQLQNDDAES